MLLQALWECHVIFSISCHISFLKPKIFCILNHIWPQETENYVVVSVIIFLRLKLIALKHKEAVGKSQIYFWPSPTISFIPGDFFND